VRKFDGGAIARPWSEAWHLALCTGNGGPAPVDGLTADARREWSEVDESAQFVAAAGGMLPAGRSVWRGIESVPLGTVRSAPRRYRSLPRPGRSFAGAFRNPEQLVDGLIGALAEAVERDAPGSSAVPIAFSGGVDSILIAIAVRRVLRRSAVLLYATNSADRFWRDETSEAKKIAHVLECEFVPVEMEAAIDNLRAPLSKSRCDWIVPPQPIEVAIMRAADKFSAPLVSGVFADEIWERGQPIRFPIRGALPEGATSSQCEKVISAAVDSWGGSRRRGVTGSTQGNAWRALASRPVVESLLLEVSGGASSTPYADNGVRKYMDGVPQRDMSGSVAGRPVRKGLCRAYLEHFYGIDPVAGLGGNPGSLIGMWASRFRGEAVELCLDHRECWIEWLNPKVVREAGGHDWERYAFLLFALTNFALLKGARGQ